MKERYAAFLTPLMASPTAEKRPFLPKPTGHSPPVAGASLAVSASVLLSPSFPGLRARVLVERRALERPARRLWGPSRDLTDFVTQRTPDARLVETRAFAAGTAPATAPVTAPM